MPKLTEKPVAEQDESPIVGSAWENTYEKDGEKKTMLKIRLSNKFSSLEISDQEELVLWPNENMNRDTSPQYLVKVSPIQQTKKEETPATA